MKAKLKDLAIGLDGTYNLTLTTGEDLRVMYDNLHGKELSVEIKEFRNRRSLDANAYAWVLMQKLAVALHTSREEVYLLMLERYGVFTHLIVKPAVVERMGAEWRAFKELGEVTVNGTTRVQIQLFFGSHTYDTKEMSALIDGIVDECKNLGIETMTPEELDRIKGEWAR